MKKAILFLLLIAFFPKPASGQVLIGLLFGDKLSTETFHLGVDVGLNLSNLSGIDGTGVKPGLIFGLLGEWRFADNFYLQPELLPFYKVGANKMPPPGSLDDPPIGELVEDKSYSRRMNYFAIPIIVKYALMEQKLHLGLGPQIGFLSSATDTYEGVVTNKITVDQNVEDTLNGTDAGVVFHAEYKFRGQYGMSVAARFYLGLTDTIKDNPGDAVYNRVFSLLASIPIGGDPTEEDEDNE
ncbi:MAG: PorT family protein [Candidatus Latescibacterota bacterium]|nr:MAG: PorT family protein [Candidatus Latescibacterota bacterium]